MDVKKQNICAVYEKPFDRIFYLKNIFTLAIITQYKRFIITNHYLFAIHSENITKISIHVTRPHKAC